MGVRKELIGKTFGLLTVKYFSYIDSTGNAYWTCLCECGNSTVVRGCSLTRGDTKSCGCRIGFQDIEKRIAKKLDISTSGCWEWKGSVTPSGYGRIFKDGKRNIVSRVSYEVFVGPIPKGLLVCHHCDNRRCCNPDHLYLGTQHMNINDAVSRGRMAKGSSSGASVLTEAEVLEIRLEFLNGNSNISSIARKFKVDWGTIDSIISRKTWRHI